MKKSTLNSINRKMKTAIFLFSLGLTISLSARENISGTGGSGAASGGSHRNANSNNAVMQAGCVAGSTQQEIQLNNVRTRILTDGDMWWDFAASIAKYEIPKGSNSYAQFAGSLWFGGYVGPTIHMSAMTYRQNGIDFWPGPLNPTDLSISVATCQAYDKVWTFNRTDVNNFYAYWLQYGVADPATPTWIKDYPGNPVYPGYTVDIPTGTNGNGLANTISPMNYLAPYVDKNGDGQYNYSNGDYPAYRVNTSITPGRGQCVRYLFGDQTLFFVFNDNGNSVHGETNGKAIGVEIRGQAFEFSTSDQLNDMSFYNYEIINWSTNTVDSTFFTVWDDCDLGNYQDDYVGCDVGRGLGYQYNGDNYDDDNGGQTGYHDKLPAIGCDFFQGPYADLGDSIDNDRDGCVDCTWQLDGNGNICPSCGPPILDKTLPEQCIMSRFTYYNNTGSQKNGNPNGFTQYYNLMSGKWEDGSIMGYGNSGLTSGATACKFLFPGNSDPLGWGLGYHPNGVGASSTQGTPIAAPIAYGATGWTEGAVGNPPGDRRFMQSAGKFTLLPGAVNYVTFGLPFARSNSNNNLEPIPLMLAADDKAQSLFDNCFKVLDGPDAPDLTIQELNQQLLVTLTNNPYTSNNYEGKRYADFDPAISLPAGFTDKTYRFEGYKVFQLLDGTVSVTDLTNSNLARLVFQCDIKNGVGTIINYNTDAALGIVPQLMVSGADAGIQNSFSITEDQFASSDKRLINFRNYYYMAVAYAYNSYLPYKQDVSPGTILTTTLNVNDTIKVKHITGTGTNTVSVTVDSLVPHITIQTVNPASGDVNGQKKPYLQGRNNAKVITAIPHNPAPEAYGTVMNSSYGSGPQVTRIEGQGNGGYALDLTDASVADILNPANNSRAQQITYVAGRTPLLVKVIDPLRVVKGDFTVKFVTATSQTSGSGVIWSYDGNPPVAGTTTLDTGKVKNSASIKWVMTGTYTAASGDKVTKSWLSDEGLSVAQEKIITGLNNESLGFSVTIKQVTDPQITARYIQTSTVSNAPKVSVGATAPGDLIESSIDGGGWLSGVQDVDGDYNRDWILSGTGQHDIAQHDTISGKTLAPAADPSSVWEGVVNGTWAPFRFSDVTAASITPSSSSPTYIYNFPSYDALAVDVAANKIMSSPGKFDDTRLLSSVDIVFTKDKSKWTRCPVVDMNPAKNPATGIPYKWQLRTAASVDKSGSTATNSENNDYPTGMGWFPGYAINVETGERLNIIFSENSADATNNGNDMMWNPTNVVTKDSTITGGTIIKSVNGGMHYVYILGHNADGNFTIGSEVIPSDVRRYDAGQSAYQMLKGLPSWPASYTPGYTAAQKGNKWTLLAELFKDIMWCGMPLSSVDLKNGPQNITNDAKVKIRVIKPFRYGLSTVTSAANTSFSTTATGNLGLTSTAVYTCTPLNSNAVANLPSDVVSNPKNGNFPMYSFSTNDLAASNYQLGTAQAALALINIVPNPYYAHSSYEQTRIDLQVRIINLPVKCTIKIYTLSGTLIRTLTKDNSDTYMSWDLHNSANIQIASGLYVLHIDAPGIGERIIKWYGVMRPYDLQSY